ncbi:MAG: hypothetical protein JJ896_06660 [Rhodothermales bacterium]|nr:hypothetical protein [Rhodothermales bacterium]MBO6779317.1 hypothetical protein [Rhodothermales bacterium]
MAVVWLVLAVVFVPSGVITRLLEWTGIPLAGGEVFVTVYIPMLFATACVIWLGYFWAAIPAYLSTAIVALVGGVPLGWTFLFAFANPLGLGVFFMAYRAVPVRTDLRSASSLAFFTLTAFAASLVGSAGSFVWGYTNNVGLNDLFPVWQGWWLGGFLQTMLFNAPLFALLGPRVEDWKARNGLGRELQDALSSTRLRLAFGVIIGALFGYVILVRNFSLARLDAAMETLSAQDPVFLEKISEAFEGLSLVHWVTLLLIGATGVFGYHTMMHWTRVLRESRDALSEANVKLLDEIEWRLQAEVELEEKARQLKEANDTKDRFFSIISHDLRSPLAAVQTLATALRNDFDSYQREAIREFIAHMVTASSNLADLMDNLLSWARLQTGVLEHRPERVNVHDTARRLVAVLGPGAEEKGVALEVEVEQDVVAWADPNMLSSITLNLLSNGLKFTSDGGRVRLSASRSNGRVHVAVSDTGVGMAPEDIERLFRIDTAFSTPGTNRERGSGLGLILSQDMVGRHGSRLKVESTLGEGTTFRFDLPAEEEPAEVHT